MSVAPELVILEGIDRGQALALPYATLTLGRGDATDVRGNQVSLADSTVSREQATLQWEPLLRAFILTHSPHASNVTRVNDRPVLRQVLRPGDRIRVGHVLLELRGFEAPAEPEAPVEPDTLLTVEGRRAGEREPAADCTVEVRVEGQLSREGETTATRAPGAAWHIVFTRPETMRGSLILTASSLAQGRTITMGGPGGRANEIAVLDARVPGRAASLEHRDGTFQVVNEGAADLLTVNGRPVEGRMRLRSGDVIGLGECVFVLGEGLPTGERPWDATTWVEVISGLASDVGRRAALEGPALSVGRERACGLAVRDPRVSRHHVTIRCEGEAFVLEHRSRRNPTLVNGVEVHRDRTLSHGDEIQVSERTILRFVVRALEVFR